MVISRIARLKTDWLVGGDAGLTFDVLSGQGASRAIQWGVQVADTIARRSGSTGYATPFRDYADILSRDLPSRLRLRHQFYELEKRWCCFTFWQRWPPSPSAPMSGSVMLTSAGKTASHKTPRRNSWARPMYASPATEAGRMSSQQHRRIRDIGEPIS